MAPVLLSVVENCGEVLRFCDRITLSAHFGPVNLDLSHVHEFSIDAQTAVIGQLASNYAALHAVHLILPRNECLRAGVESSEFSDLLEVVGAGSGKASARTSIIRPIFEPDAIVDVATASVRFASGLLYGNVKRKLPVAYSAIIECIANSLKHSGATEGTRVPAWIGVGRAADAHRAAFVLLDRGVGLFEHPSIQAVLGAVSRAAMISGRFTGYVPSLVRIDALRAMMEGRVESRTGLRFRGKGLPSLYRALIRQRIRRLVIVANDVYADIEADEYLVLRTPYQGTIIYWEIAPDDTTITSNCGEK